MNWGDPRVPAQLWNRIIPITETSCLLWLGAVCGADPHDGYGFVTFRTEDGARRSMVAHRRLWSLVHGEPKPDLELDHLCRTRLCVNIDHLELVTPQINTLRGTSPAAENALKDACPFGHAYDAANTRWVNYRGRRARRCIICTRIRDLNRPSRARAARRDTSHLEDS